MLPIDTLFNRGNVPVAAEATYICSVDMEITYDGNCIIQSIWGRHDSTVVKPFACSTDDPGFISLIGTLRGTS